MNASSPVNPQYTHHTKGGRYELVGTSTRAGDDMRGEEIIVYRDKKTRRLFHRSPMNFAQALNPVASLNRVYDLEEYDFDQWWVVEIRKFESTYEVTNDLKRAVLVALNFLEIAFKTLKSVPLPNSTYPARYECNAGDGPGLYVDQDDKGDFMYADEVITFIDRLRATLPSQPGKYDEVLKPFMRLMERELHANSSKGDRPAWITMSADECVCEIYYHVFKLQAALKEGKGDEITEYAADVANLSMMLTDVTGGLALEAAKGASNETTS